MSEMEGIDGTSDPLGDLRDVYIESGSEDEVLRQADTKEGDPWSSDSEDEPHAMLDGNGEDDDEEDEDLKGIPDPSRSQAKGSKKASVRKAIGKEEKAKLRSAFGEIKAKPTDNVQRTDVLLSSDDVATIQSMMTTQMPGLAHLFSEKAIKNQFSSFVKEIWGIGRDVIAATSAQGKTGQRAQKQQANASKKAAEAARVEELKAGSVERLQKAKEEADDIIAKMSQLKIEAEHISLLQGRCAELGDSDRGLDVFRRSCEVLNGLANRDLPPSDALTACAADCISVLENIANYLIHEDEVEVFVNKYNVIDTETFNKSFKPSLALEAQTSPQRPGGDPALKRTAPSDFEHLNLGDIKTHLKRNFKKNIQNSLTMLKGRMDFIHQQAVLNSPAKKTTAEVARRLEEPDPSSVASKKEALTVAEERVKSLKEELIKEQLKVRKLQHELHPVEQQDEETRFLAVMARPRLGGNVVVWSTADEPLSPLIEELIITRLSPYSSLKPAMEDKKNSHYTP